ncbi:MAG: DUF4344 domain-containing metallopeptidase [Variibacter sp.]
MPLLLVLGTEPLLAQDAAPPQTAATAQSGSNEGAHAKSAFELRIEQTAQALASEPRLKNFSPQERLAIVEFVFGNMLFAAAHELGHGVIRELELPVLGREEDAADAFAIIAALWVGTDFSHRVLVEAVRGWFLSDARDEKVGATVAYYDEHGMNLQRAYQIVCYMVGSDPQKFKDLAQETKLPEERQKGCQAEYREQLWSWETSLKPHRRAPGAPKQKIEVTYGDAEGALAPYARSFRDTRFLETLIERVADRFAWPRPLKMEMRTCGESGAVWKAGKLTLCYELAQEFSQLCREYGVNWKISTLVSRRRR